MRAFFALGLLIFSNGSAFATPDTAFQALKILPVEQAKNLACIVGRDGAPEPNQWHFLIHDATAENDLREFVVEEHQVVATRGISQFVERLKPEDVIAGQPLRIDSEAAQKIARTFAAANHFTVAQFDYELRRPAFGAAPVWTITCRDETGQKIGALTILAADGRRIAQSGFSRAALAQKKSGEPSGIAPEPATDSDESDQPHRTTSAERKRRPEPRTPRTAPEEQPPPVADKKRGPIDSLGHGIHRLFGGGN